MEYISMKWAYWRNRPIAEIYYHLVYLFYISFHFRCTERWTSKTTKSFTFMCHLRFNRLNRVRFICIGSAYWWTNIRCVWVCLSARQTEWIFDVKNYERETERIPEKVYGFNDEKAVAGSVVVALVNPFSVTSRVKSVNCSRRVAMTPSLMWIISSFPWSSNWCENYEFYFHIEMESLCTELQLLEPFFFCCCSCWCSPQHVNICKIQVDL